uniref:Uncharacterized protein n=1 Tax=Rhipicephalus zambeziensis TaxID=60191 RepID=A0A224YJS2_9ACAR
MCMSRQLLKKKKKKGGVYMTTLCRCGNCSAVSHAAEIVCWFSSQNSLCRFVLFVCWSMVSVFVVYQKKKKMVISCNCAVKMSTPCECMCVLSVRMMLHHVVTPRKIVLNGDANFSLKVQLLFASAHSSWQEP